MEKRQHQRHQQQEEQHQQEGNPVVHSVTLLLNMENTWNVADNQALEYWYTVKRVA